MDFLRIAARVAAKSAPGSGAIVVMSWDEPESGRAVFSVDGLSREELDQVAAWSEAVSGDEWGHALPSIEIREGRAKEVLDARDFADAIRYTEGVYTAECPVFKAHGVKFNKAAVSRTYGVRSAEKVLSTVRSASVPVTVDASSHGRLESDDQPRHPRHSQHGSNPAHEKASYSVSGTVGGVPYSVTGVIRVLGCAIDEDEDEDGHHVELIPHTSDAEFNEDVVFTLAGKAYEGKSWKEWPEDVTAASDSLWESRAFWGVVEGLTEAVGERFVEESGGDVMDSAADSAALAKDPYKYHGVKRSDFY